MDRPAARLGYVSGVYSSAGSGIEMLDDARVERPGMFTLPDAIWIARWDLQADTSTSYIRDDGWLPGGPMKQYQGGHDETWGGVRINIDRNYLDLGLGSVAARETHCGGTRISYWRYRALDPGSSAVTVSALQCLLKEKGLYAAQVTGVYDGPTAAAAAAWMTAHGFPPQQRFAPRHWVALLSEGSKPVVKIGSAGPDVRRLQRALSAADAGAESPPRASSTPRPTTPCGTGRRGSAWRAPASPRPAPGRTSGRACADLQSLRTPRNRSAVVFASATSGSPPSKVSTSARKRGPRRSASAGHGTTQKCRWG